MTITGHKMSLSSKDIIIEGSHPPATFPHTRGLRENVSTILQHISVGSSVGVAHTRIIIIHWFRSWWEGSRIMDNSTMDSTSIRHIHLDLRYI